jgi:N-methylhydantoinase A/oxoprolinase/acetone carboxylase beta subunit
MGLLTTDLRYDLATTAFLRSDTLTAADLSSQFERLEQEARAALRHDGFEEGEITILRKVDCRYLGQGYELPIEIRSHPGVDVDALQSAFHELHEREYGYSFPDNVIEIVTARVTGIGAMPKIPAPSVSENGRTPLSAASERDVYFRVNGHLEAHPSRFLQRNEIRPGSQVDGPAVVLQTDSTTVIPPGWTAEADASGNIVLRHAAGAR